MECRYLRDPLQVRVTPSTNCQPLSVHCPHSACAYKPPGHFYSRLMGLIGLLWEICCSNGLFSFLSLFRRRFYFGTIVTSLLYLRYPSFFNSFVVTPRRTRRLSRLQCGRIKPLVLYMNLGRNHI